eukprot:Gb_11438 [translate_table: standard]
MSSTIPVAQNLRTVSRLFRFLDSRPYRPVVFSASDWHEKRGAGEDMFVEGDLEVVIEVFLTTMADLDPSKELMLDEISNDFRFANKEVSSEIGSSNEGTLLDTRT